MVFPIFLNSNLKHKRKRFINTIEKNGLQTRPVISGSFVNQPATKLYALNEKKNLRSKYNRTAGFCYWTSYKKTNKQIDFIKNSLFLIDKI